MGLVKTCANVFLACQTAWAAVMSHCGCAITPSLGFISIISPSSPVSGRIIIAYS